MMPNIGPLEIGVLLIVALVVFGPKRLPELGSSMGKAIRGFGHGIKGEESAPLPSTQGSGERSETVAAVVEPPEKAAG